MRNVKIIAAVSEDAVYGVDGKLPWRSPEDLRYFKQVTRNSTVIMGRATWDSLGKYKPLPDRENVVVTSQNTDAPEGVILANSLDAAIEIASCDGIFVIGGKMLWLEAIEKGYATELLVTKVGVTVLPCDGALICEELANPNKFYNFHSEPVKDILDISGPVPLKLLMRRYIRH